MAFTEGGVTDPASFIGSSLSLTSAILLNNCVKSPYYCREKLRPGTQDRPKAYSEAEEENFEHFPE